LPNGTKQRQGKVYILGFGVGAMKRLEGTPAKKRGYDIGRTGITLTRTSGTEKEIREERIEKFSR